jgi:anti-sigma factor RsiW
MDHDVLSAYLDGELDDAARARVETQLAGSTVEAAAWRAELAEVQGARDLLRAVAEREAPDGFWDAVLASVAATASGGAADTTSPGRADHPGVAATEDQPADGIAAVVSLDERRRGPRRWVATAFAAAAAVALAVIVVPQRDPVVPDVAAVVVQHGAQASDRGDPVSTITPVGPLAGIRR